MKQHIFILFIFLSFVSISVRWTYGSIVCRRTRWFLLLLRLPSLHPSPGEHHIHAPRTYTISFIILLFIFLFFLFFGFAYIHQFVVSTVCVCAVRMQYLLLASCFYCNQNWRRRRLSFREMWVASATTHTHTYPASSIHSSMFIFITWYFSLLLRPSLHVMFISFDRSLPSRR